MFLNPQIDRLLDNILPNLDQTSDIGIVVDGLLYQLKVQNNICQEAVIAFQRLESDAQELESEAQELRSEIEEYRQLTDGFRKLNDQLSANNIHLSEDNSKLRDENLRLLDENYELNEKIAQSRKGEGSQ